MLDLLGPLVSLLDNNEACAVATIISATGSVHREVGTSMLVSRHGEVAGSLSGGCVEGAVFEAALEAIGSGTAGRQRFGFSAEDAFAVGLSCGGELDVFIQPVYPEAGPALAALAHAPAGAPAALIRRLDGPCPGILPVPDPERFPAQASGPAWRAGLLGLLGSADAVESALPQLLALIGAGQTGLIRLSLGRRECPREPVTLFVESRMSAPRLYLFGANDYSAALSRAAKPLGYRVILCDARPVFANRSRYPQADEIVIEWPDRFLRRRILAGQVDARSVLCVLTHDAKFDLPLLTLALAHNAAYIGAMGSRRSHEQRMAGLRANGLSEAQLARLHSPIGLNIGAVTPEEVALSILAEVVATRRALPHGPASGLPLHRLCGPIHAAAPVPSGERLLSGECVPAGERMGAEAKGA